MKPREYGVGGDMMCGEYDTWGIGCIEEYDVLGQYNARRNMMCDDLFYLLTAPKPFVNGNTE